MLTVAEIDAELAARGREADAITATMLELDKHPGLGLLRGYEPTGVTATRWRAERQRLDLMWEDFGRLQSILDQARTLRARRHRIGDTERAELTRLLRDRSYEVERTRIPMGMRSLTGPSERVRAVGVADTLSRLRAAYPVVAEFLDAVDTINTKVLTGLSPIQAQLDRWGGATAELRALADDVAELLARSATDPLALTPAGVDSQVTSLAVRLRRESESLAEVRALTADWPAAIAHTRDRLEAVRSVRARAERTRAEAEREIDTAPLPFHPDEAPLLHTALLAATDVPGPDSAGTSGARGPSSIGGGTVSGAGVAIPVAGATLPMAMALVELRGRIEAAVAAARADLDLAQGLLDRRAELRGRLAAYRAKAVRLGADTHPEVSAAAANAAALLSRRPCDLAAVTRAIADYRQVIAERSGRRT